MPDLYNWLLTSTSEESMEGAPDLARECAAIYVRYQG